MKQLLLATALIAVPVAAFTAFNLFTSGASVAVSGTAAAGLGDMSAFSAIVSDVQNIAASGDLAGAKTRIKDLETAWDDRASELRALDGNAWGVIDDAADAALSALRAGTPDAGDVKTTLDALQASLNAPAPVAASAGAVVLVAGVAVTDANGRALPCEEMLTTLRDKLVSATPSEADRAAAVAFQTKATERCNADDDKHADEFSAQGLALLQ